jgi:hypothetical protein
MRLSSARWSLPLIIAALTTSPADSPNPTFRGVAYFEPPRSVGTPIDEVARGYTGLGLADKIAGRLRLDTDASLNPRARALIRRRLARQAT